jgi:hypothetical protein
MRQLHYASSLVAYRRQIPHFGHSEQALILWVFVSDSMEEVDILNGGEALDLEVAESP